MTTSKEMTSTRPLHEIAQEIESVWQKPSSRAVGPLHAMKSLRHVHDRYLNQSGRGVIVSFLMGAFGWRGEDARRIKAELKHMATTFRL